MIPTPIDDDLIKPGTVRRVFTAPSGDPLDENIAPCEALVSLDPASELVAVHVRLELEPDEIERLAAGRPVWLTMLGNLAPFDVKVESGEAGPR